MHAYYNNIMYLYYKSIKVFLYFWFLKSDQLTDASVPPQLQPLDIVPSPLLLTTQIFPRRVISSSGEAALRNLLSPTRAQHLALLFRLLSGKPNLQPCIETPMWMKIRHSHQEHSEHPYIHTGAVFVFIRHALKTKKSLPTMCKLKKNCFNFYFPDTVYGDTQRLSRARSSRPACCHTCQWSSHRIWI